MNNAPDITDIIGGMLSSKAKTMFGGWLPGRIESYDEATRKASVSLLVESSEVVEGETITKPYDVITECPVMFPGSNGVRMSWPINVGDTVMVVFAARDISKWSQLGSRVVPDDDRDHDITDAAIIPGLMDFANAQDATPQIKFTNTTIEAGGNLAMALLSELNNLRTFISAQFTGIGHTHATPGGPSTATTVAASTTIPSAYPGTTVLKGK